MYYLSFWIIHISTYIKKINCDQALLIELQVKSQLTIYSKWHLCLNTMLCHGYANEVC